MSRRKDLILYQLVLSLMENRDYISAHSLAKMIGISERNVRNKIDDLDVILKESSLGSIERIPRKGMKIVYEEKNEFSIRKLFENYEYLDFIVGEETLYTYLRIILSNSNQKLTVSELSQLVFDSIPVCSRNLNTCKQWLSLFNIDLLVKRNLGIVLDGREESIRLAINHLVINDPMNQIEQSIKHFAKGINLDLLKLCVKQIEIEWNFKFADESYNSILLYAALAITRSSFSELYLTDNEEEIVLLYNEYNLAQSLFRIIDEKFFVKTPEEEIKFFAIQLLCSRFIHSDIANINNPLQTYDNKLKEFVNKIINVVSEIFNTDLTQDTELYYGLLNHIRPAIFRMKFEKHSTSDLTNFIQEKYQHTYRVSWALSMLFEEYYDISISSTELSYITLYIQASLDRRVKPLRIALVTELGMGLNQMFCNKMKLSIPKIDEIKIYNFHDFKPNIIDNHDLIVTTSKLPYDNDKIIQIKSLLTGSGVELLNKKIESLREGKISEKSKFDPDCHSFFDPRLIVIKPQVLNKNELIRLMCQKLEEFGFVNDRYVTTVLEREKTVSTYLGSRVAIPHGYQINVNESKIVVATLESPIRWNENEEVQVAFMLAIRISNAFESNRMQIFYKGFLNLIETDSDVDEIIGMSKNELYEFLIR